MGQPVLNLPVLPHRSPGSDLFGRYRGQRGMAAIRGVLLPSFHQPIALCQWPERSDPRVGGYRRNIALGPITRDRFSCSRAFKPIRQSYALQGGGDVDACVDVVMPGLSAFPWPFITPRRSWLLALV